MENSNVFDRDYSRYYNLLYKDKNYQAEVNYVHRLLKQFRPQGRTIIEYGSGTGRHGVLFKKLGYEILGIERSAEMAEIARSEGLNCHVADIRDYKVDGKFDICLALFHVVSYINDNQSLLQLLEVTKAHLAPGGIFIFDVWFSPAVLNQLPEVRVKRMSDDNIEIIRLAEPVVNFEANTVDVNYQVLIREKSGGVVREFRESHPMRHFSVPEIELLALQSGFRLLHKEEFLTSKKPDNTTWGVTFILQAND
jgi:SAM-dependent methyltransferase